MQKPANREIGAELDGARLTHSFSQPLCLAMLHFFEINSCLPDPVSFKLAFRLEHIETTASWKCLCQLTELLN